MAGLEAIALLLVMGALAICVFIEVIAFRRLNGVWKLLVVPPLIVPFAIVGMIDETVFLNVKWFTPEIAFPLGLIYMVVLTPFVTYVLRKNPEGSANVERTANTLAEENGCLAAALTVFMAALSLVAWLFYMFVLT